MSNSVTPLSCHIRHPATPTPTFPFSMGTIYMAAARDVTLGVLGEAGSPYSLLLPRSVDFQPFFEVLKSRWPRSLDRVIALAAAQSLWDRTEGSGWASYVSGAAHLPNTPPHRVIYHYGLGDAQVTWLGTETVARSVGAVIFASNVREGNESLASFTNVPDNSVLTTGSLAMGIDFGFPPVPFTNTPPTDVRRSCCIAACCRRTPTTHPALDISNHSQLTTALPSPFAPVCAHCRVMIRMTALSGRTSSSRRLHTFLRLGKSSTRATARAKWCPQITVACRRSRRDVSARARCGPQR